MSYREYQEEVLEYARFLSHRGFFGTISGTGGNVSRRVDGEEFVVVTPSGRNYHQANPEEMCLVDFQGCVLEGAPRPSMETGMHLAVYRQRPEAGAVIHTHQDFASVFSVLHLPVPLLFDEARLGLKKQVEVIPYAPSGSRKLEQKVAESLSGGATCYLLQNHGALCVGEDLPQAFYRAELLEKCARVYYYALCTGREITFLPEDSSDAYSGG